MLPSLPLKVRKLVNVDVLKLYENSDPKKGVLVGLVFEEPYSTVCVGSKIKEVNGKKPPGVVGKVCKLVNVLVPRLYE